MKPLIVLELANNHGGSVKTGLNTIKAFAKVVAPYRDYFDFGFKLQYRDLDTFIHPNFRENTDIKYIKRFLSTRLSEGHFLKLRQAMSQHGFMAICTPFDEPSVDLVVKHHFDTLKIASCSFGDWPLMEKIADAGLPVIASTGGASLDTLDTVVAFFRNRKVPLALLHCIAIYPTYSGDLQLNQVDFLKKRYPDLKIGFSTHENSSNVDFVKMAIAKGVEIIEKHVGIGDLNAYSSTPSQMSLWLDSAREALEACGEEFRYVPEEREESSLHSLRRGAWLTKAVGAGEQIHPRDLTLCMPTQDGQLTANDLGKYVRIFAEHDLLPGPLWEDCVRIVDSKFKVRNIMSMVQDMLREAKITLPQKTEVELSHHYGLDRFYFHGVVIVNIMNREYCKKLLVLFPSQLHPEHHHIRKEETFHVLSGDVTLWLDGVRVDAKMGDLVTIERGVNHSFTSDGGAIVEEVSTTHLPNDSIYSDPQITSNHDRKTIFTHYQG